MSPIDYIACLNSERGRRVVRAMMDAARETFPPGGRIATAEQTRATPQARSGFTTNRNVDDFSGGPDGGRYRD
jgi:hypothetical protein